MNRSVTSPPFISLYEAVFAIIVLTVCLFYGGGFTADPGVGWHLATGRYILEHGVIPSFDPFLHAPSVRPWVCDQWLIDIVFYLIHKNFGFFGCYVLISLCFLVAYLGFFATAVRKAVGSGVAVPWGIILAVQFGSIHFLLRGTVFGICLFTVLYGHLLAKGIRTSIDYLVIFVIFLVWANVHPSFGAGILLVGVWSFGQEFSRLEYLSKISFSMLIRACIPILVALAATLINPSGIKLHESISLLVQDPFFMKYHMEWLSPGLDDVNGKSFFLVFGFLLGCELFSKRQLYTRVELMLVLLFGYLAIDAMRMIPYFGLVAAIPLIKALRFIGATISPFLPLAIQNGFNRLTKREIDAGSGIRGAITASFVLIILISLYGVRPDHYEEAKNSPQAAIAWMVNHAAELSAHGQVVVAASADLGGHITWTGNGVVKPVIDDRNTLLGSRFYKRYDRDFQVSTRVHRLFVDIGADVVLLRKNSPLARYLACTKRYSRVYNDTRYVVFDVTP